MAILNFYLTRKLYNYFNNIDTGNRLNFPLWCLFLNNFNRICKFTGHLAIKKMSFVQPVKIYKKNYYNQIKRNLRL